MPLRCLKWCALLVLAVSGCSQKQRDDSSTEKLLAAEREANWLALPESEQDLANTYLPALMLEPHVLAGEKGEAECSGVLMGPGHVLTAGRCLCRGLSCASDVNVTALRYGPRGGSAHATYDNTSQSGTVLPPPDSGPGSTSLQTRLALISVRPMKRVAPIPFATTPTTIGELVTIVGYAHDSLVGGAFRMRHLVQGKVVGSGAEGTADFLIDPAVHARLVPGDRGAPCLRQSEQGIVLVGILVESSPQRVVCTGIDSYRPWLLEELQRAASAATAPLPSTP